MRSALVIGSGVAGPVAAMALQRAGIDATICEAHPCPADDVGAFLTLQINGIGALRAIGIELSGLGFASPSIRLRSGSGRVLGEVSTGEPLADGTVGRCVRRTDLYRVLREEALARGIPIEYGRRLVDATATAAGVRARFADGDTAEAGLLIGADGIRSRVREIIDPAATPARYVPVLNIGGFAPPQATQARGGSFEMIFGRRAFFGYGVAPDGGVWWFANPPRPVEPAPGELAGTTTGHWRTWLRELYTADRSPACAIIDSTPGELTGWATYDLPSVRHWHRDRMIVIGDAAHATSPASGQGASLAIEDAVELARCLRDLPGPDAALRAYEGMRRSRVERVVAFGARMSNSKAAGPIGRVLRDAMLPLVLRLGDTAPTWVHHHRIDFAAPVTAPDGTLVQ